ncbi:MAG TPA: hypothetical protein VFY87_18270 [Geminicoccaceae bacterium]|nr:hypothetical protein [Geminicoccaceae bacterium]
MQQEHGSGFRGRAATERHRDGGWQSREKGEPRLDELLDDPMMKLLWRRDRLEPALARAAVRALQALVRDGGRHRVGALGPDGPALAALGLPR